MLVLRVKGLEQVRWCRMSGVVIMTEQPRQNHHKALSKPLIYPLLGSLKPDVQGL